MVNDWPVNREQILHTHFEPPLQVDEGDVVSAAFNSISDAFDTVLDVGQKQKVQLDIVAGFPRLLEVPTIPSSAERSLENEIAPLTDELLKAGKDEPSGFDLRPLRGKWRKATGDFVRVDEIKQRQSLGCETLDERRFPGPIRSSDDIKGRHGIAGDLSECFRKKRDAQFFRGLSHSEIGRAERKILARSQVAT